MLGTISLMIALVAALVAGLSVTSSQADTHQRWTPPPKTIVAVEGNKANGFTIHHYDGSTLFPPTGSEAFAECGAYDDRIKVVRCRTEARVWYRELGKLKRSLRYAWSVSMAT
ncbi:MAG: hypothetical protein L0H93_15665 [Nocardioides sp.]|nr:hypothetical protein [Nocardioides sp.]